MRVHPDWVEDDVSLSARLLVVYGAGREDSHNTYFEARHVDTLDFVAKAYRDDLVIEGGLLREECARHILRTHARTYGLLVIPQTGHDCLVWAFWELEQMRKGRREIGRQGELRRHRGRRFGTAIQNWMVAVPAIIGLSISVACWNR